MIASFVKSQYERKKHFLQPFSYFFGGENIHRMPPHAYLVGGMRPFTRLQPLTFVTRHAIVAHPCFSYAEACIKALKVTKIVKQIKFEEAWWQVGSKILFTETILAKIFQTNCTFSVKQHHTGKVQFLFLKDFLLVLTKL